MKNLISIIILIILMTSCKTATNIKYPVTIKDNVVEKYFNTDVQDPYRWLENDRSEATASWVIAQNKVTYDYLDKISFRDDLKKRMTELLDYPKQGTPFKKNNKYYYLKNNGLQNQSVLFQQSDVNAQAIEILDPNKLSKDGTIALSQFTISKNGKYLAYSIARSGSDWNEIFIMNLETKELLTDHIKWVKFSGIAWQGDGFFYSAYDAPIAGKEYSNKNEFHKVFYHKIGEAQKQDKIIYENPAHPLRNCRASVSDNEKFLFISVTESTSGNSLLFKRLNDEKATFKMLASNFEDDYTIVDNIDEKIYILTNLEASNQRLVEVDANNPDQKNWKTILPETKNVLQTVQIVGGRIIAQYLENAANKLYTYHLNGQKIDELKLPTIGTISAISGDKDDNEMFYSFTSFTFPPTIYRHNISENKSEIFSKSKVSFNTDDFVSEQVFFTSKDGTKVPMFITYKKGTKKDGKNPLMLYGYGGFNISLNPSFNVARIPFIENGGIYVVANIRGGGEYGEAWHMAGTKLNKQNVFDDFIAAAEFLIKEKYTNSSKLAINGGSNGGLLVGACMTQRPDLFAVAIPEVGVLDMLRYHKFTIGWAWATDYGTSEDNIEMFNYLKAYSPIHNVKADIKYPATMIMTGDHDDRVVPAHSFKFAATIQDANNKKYASLIRIDTNAGHGAGKPTSKIIDAYSDMWSFVMFNLNMNPKF